MAFASKIVLAVAAFGTSCILHDMAKADDVPDALSVEWQGKKPCEKLFDDEHVRVAAKSPWMQPFQRPRQARRWHRSGRDALRPQSRAGIELAEGLNRKNALFAG